VKIRELEFFDLKNSTSQSMVITMTSWPFNSA